MLNKLRDLLFTVFWIRKGFIGGRPKAIKNRVLSRYLQMDGAWVETGTIKGKRLGFWLVLAVRSIPLNRRKHRTPGGFKPCASG